MIKNKIVWQADVFALIAPDGAGEAVRAPVGFVGALGPRSPLRAATIYGKAVREVRKAASAAKRAWPA